MNWINCIMANHPEKYKPAVDTSDRAGHQCLAIFTTENCELTTDVRNDQTTASKGVDSTREFAY
jgi:hypothetical protein